MVNPPPRTRYAREAKRRIIEKPHADVKTVTLQTPHGSPTAPVEATEDATWEGASPDEVPEVCSSVVHKDNSPEAIMSKAKLTAAARKMRAQLRKLLYDKNPTHLEQASELISSLVGDGEMAPVLEELTGGLSFNDRYTWGCLWGFDLEEGALDAEEKERFHLGYSGGMDTSRAGVLQISKDSDVWKRCKVHNRVAVALHILKGTGLLQQQSSLSFLDCRWGAYIGGWGGGERVPLTSIDVLSGLPALTALDLEGCHDVTELGVLATLTNLRELSLKQCQIYDLKLAAIGNLPSLEVLHLAHCPVKKLDPLAKLSRLTTLGLGHCKSLTDLKGIANLSGLENLDLFDCPKITDVGALAGLTGLKRLSLRNCASVRTVDALANLTGLTYLNLDGCKSLENLDALANLDCQIVT